MHTDTHRAIFPPKGRPIFGKLRLSQAARVGPGLKDPKPCSCKQLRFMGARILGFRVYRF